MYMISPLGSDVGQQQNQEAGVAYEVLGINGAFNSV
jgi:hypothetical protein